MAAEPNRFRHYSIYYGGLRAKMITGTETTYTSNDEAQIADKGYEGHSDGAIMTRIQSDAVVPVQGMGIQALADMLLKKYVDIGMGIIDGKIQRLKARCVEASVSGNAQNGTQTAKFTFEGGKPELI